MESDSLDIITALSHEFGTPEFVKGGGGNTSCKNDATLWVKPSGTTLGGLAPDRFVAMDRNRLSRLYAIEIPENASQRESLVKAMMTDALLPGQTARPSVEAPLHDILEGTYVVHTHAVLVNGLTCSVQGEAFCRELFPHALWIPYIDPGFILCMDVLKRVKQAETETGTAPHTLILENHGIFITGNTTEDIRDRYQAVLEPLQAVYADSTISTDLIEQPVADDIPEAVKTLLQQVMGEEASEVVPGGAFTLAEGPISPDHIVYSKSFPFTDDVTEENLVRFKERNGYWPKVIDLGDRVIAVGPNEKQARLALELAKDGALVMQLADAFGGIQYLDDAAREFIENWEVEAYRQKQMA